jgi:hypothetical protein
VGYVEVDVRDEAERHPRRGRLAELGNLHVEREAYEAVAGWLPAEAAAWLRLGRIDRLLTYARPDEAALIGRLRCLGFVEVTRVRRGWTLGIASPS